MGIPSPFVVGPATSPSLARSRHTSPDPPLPDTVDEFNGIEVLEFFPPHLDLITEHAKAIPKVLSPWDQAAPQADDCVQEAELAQRQRPIPEWPSHWPTYLHEASEVNTFLDVVDPEEIREPRLRHRRAGSDWTGIREMEKEGVTVELEELRKPLPPPVQKSVEVAAWPEQEQTCEAQWCWMVPDQASGVWIMYCSDVQDASQMWPSGEQAQTWVEAGEPVVCFAIPLAEAQDACEMWPSDGQVWGEAQEGVVCFPEPPPEGQAYKPKWVYGSSWPFNHAPTTLILDNLPRDLTYAEFLAVLDASGFRGFYDFAFLPVSLRTGRNQGHAIVNLTRHSYGLALAARAQGFADWGESADGRCCEVKWSLPLQGIAEHIENYRNHPAMHESVPEGFRPAVFVDGWQVPFPPPTKKIRAPRIGYW